MNKGYADIVLGLQFGDEGKARVIDTLAPNYNIIARFNGGANAGHTIEQGDTKVALNQIPSGIFYPSTTLYIGSGCVINIEKLASEIKRVNDLGVDLTDRLKIASQASVIQPHHILLDEILGKTVGTTKNGIGPSYADRAIRMYGKRVANVRFADLYDRPDDFFMAILTNLRETVKQYALKNIDEDKIMNDLKEAFIKVRSYMELDPLYMNKRVDDGANVLFEGAQSIMLDVVKGSVPYVTSSSTLAAAAYSGGDLSPKYHRKTIGIVKAMMSRVGFGPFPSELGGYKSEAYTMEKGPDGHSKYTKVVEDKYDLAKLLKSDDQFEVGVAMRILSKEYGTVTQRPRRVGCFDLVMLNHAVKMNGVDELIITKCDLLKEYSRTKSGKMPIVTGYELEEKTINYVPGATSAFYRVKPVLEEREGFSNDISEVRKFDDLPKPVKDFVREAEAASGCKVVGLGVGPRRDQFISMG